MRPVAPLLGALFLVAAPVAAAELAPTGTPRIDLLVPEAPDPGAEVVSSAAEVLSRLAGMTVELRVAKDAAEARKAMGERPMVALLSLPLYLEAASGGEPPPRLLASPRRGGASVERWHLVRIGAPAGRELDLAGKRVAGTALEDARFATRLLVPEAPSVELVPVPRALQAIKMLRAGEVTAILLSDPEREALGGLVKGNELEIVRATRELPLPPVVSFQESPHPFEKRLVHAISGLCADPEGSYLCEGFGIEGFGPPDVAAYRAALEIYGAP